MSKASLLGSINGSITRHSQNSQSASHGQHVAYHCDLRGSELCSFRLVQESIKEGDALLQADQGSDDGFTTIQNEAIDGIEQGQGDLRWDENPQGSSSAAGHVAETGLADSQKTDSEKLPDLHQGDTDAADGESRSYDDIITRAEQRKEATDIVKAAVREESERMKEIPAWEKESDKQIDPRNRVGEEATKIMDDSQQLQEVVRDQSVSTKSGASRTVPKKEVETGKGRAQNGGG